MVVVSLIRVLTPKGSCGKFLWKPECQSHLLLSLHAGWSFKSQGPPSRRKSTSNIFWQWFQVQFRRTWAAPHGSFETPFSWDFQLVAGNIWRLLSISIYNLYILYIYKCWLLWGDRPQYSTRANVHDMSMVYGFQFGAMMEGLPLNTFQYAGWIVTQTAGLGGSAGGSLQNRTCSGSGTKMYKVHQSASKCKAKRSNLTGEPLKASSGSKA